MSATRDMPPTRSSVRTGSPGTTRSTSRPVPRRRTASLPRGRGPSFPKRRPPLLLRGWRRTRQQGAAVPACTEAGERRHFGRRQQAADRRFDGRRRNPIYVQGDYNGTSSVTPSLTGRMKSRTFPRRSSRMPRSCRTAGVMRCHPEVPNLVTSSGDHDHLSLRVRLPGKACRSPTAVRRVEAR